jgi:hypothetical protein
LLDIAIIVLVFAACSFVRQPLRKLIAGGSDLTGAMIRTVAPTIRG